MLNSNCAESGLLSSHHWVSGQEGRLPMVSFFRAPESWCHLAQAEVQLCAQRQAGWCSPSHIPTFAHLLFQPEHHHLHWVPNPTVRSGWSSLDHFRALSCSLATGVTYVTVDRKHCISRWFFSSRCLIKMQQCLIQSSVCWGLVWP